MHGSARLPHRSDRNDLVDEYRAIIDPVVIADGLRTFPSVEEMKLLGLAETIPTTRGCAVSGDA
jgi:hypothetical protein